MATDWVKVGTQAGIGAAVGVADQLVQNQDNKRTVAIEATGQKMPMLKQYGTYLNYGGALVAAGLVGFGAVKGELAASLVTAGFQLAGRKATHQLTNKTTLGSRPRSSAYGWERLAAQEAAQKAAAERQALSYEPTDQADIIV